MNLTMLMSDRVANPLSKYRLLIRVVNTPIHYPRPESAFQDLEFSYSSTLKLSAVPWLAVHIFSEVHSGELLYSKPKFQECRLLPQLYYFLILMRQDYQRLG